ncbi:MAG: response regulator transcription factor [Dehalococcoidia bacterium]|nr:response regulator transcription factor [Dehalococcoidia bacterium]
MELQDVNNMNHKIRTLIAEDYPLFRTILRQSLAEDPMLELVGEAQDGQEAVEKAHSLRPDVVLMDVSLPLLGGLDATRLIRQATPDTKIILLLEDDNREYQAAALASGAHACLAKVDIARSLLSLVRSL